MSLLIQVKQNLIQLNIINSNNILSIPLFFLLIFSKTIYDLFKYRTVLLPASESEGFQSGSLRSRNMKPQVTNVTEKRDAKMALLLYIYKDVKKLPVEFS